jgi:hypothetical protein
VRAERRGHAEDDDIGIGEGCGIARCPKAIGPRKRLRQLIAEGFLGRLTFGMVSFALPLYAYQRFGLSFPKL